MKSKTLTTTVSLAISSALLLTACGGGDDNPAGSGGDQPTAQEAAKVTIDLSTLDTGDFITEPSDKQIETTDKNIRLVEAQRLTEFTVLPFEIDPILSESSTGGMSVITSGPDGGMTMLLSDLTNELPAELYDVNYGYFTGGRAPANNSEAGKDISLASLAFADNAAAKSAAEALNRYWIDPVRDTARIPGKIDVLPNSYVTADGKQVGNTSTLASATVHNNFVVYTWVQAAPEKMDWITQTTAKIVAEQIKWLDKFPASDINDPATWPKIDQNDVLKYTLGWKTGGGHNQMGVYGPRGMAQSSTNPQLTYDVLTEVGANHNAVAGGVVYRAKNDEGAERISDSFLSDIRTKNGFTDESTPKGLEGTNTHCLTHPLKDVTVCYTVVGRYVGETSGDVTEAQQRISALYSIFQQADQNAT